MKIQILSIILIAISLFYKELNAISPFPKVNTEKYFSIGDSAVLPSAYNKLHLGIEIEVTPFILKGYILQGWLSLGNAPFRLRINMAQNNIPNFFLDKKIAKEKLKSISLNMDFFLKEQFNGIYFTGGLAYFNQNIHTKEPILNNNNQNNIQEYSHFENNSIAISLGMGYNFFFYKGFYIAPWLGFHTRLNNGQNIEMTPDFTYKPTFVYPEIAFKIGWHIGRYNKYQY